MTVSLEETRIKLVKSYVWRKRDVCSFHLKKTDEWQVSAYLGFWYFNISNYHLTDNASVVAG